jgi:hypothetical protein
MNKCLLLSSIICGLLILIIIYKKYNPNYHILYKLIIFGVITSIINHGTTNQLFKYLDRLIIMLNIIYIYSIIKYKENITEIIILILAIMCYIYSKCCNNVIIKNSFHSFSHILSVVLFNIIN